MTQQAFPENFPAKIRPEILFEDQHVCVLSKPAGLLSQGESTGDLNLVDYLRQYFGRNYVGLVHRLDRNTSGVMVVAKRTKAAQRLTEALQKDQITRTYLAWVEGSLAGPVRWEHRLYKDETKNLVRVAPGHPKAQHAVLNGRPVEQKTLEGASVTLLEIVLETGRPHQIRVQASHEKHPLLGDPKYGSGSGVSRKFQRPLLHSFRIEFPHPMTQALLRFEAPLPLDMQI